MRSNPKQYPLFYLLITLSRLLEKNKIAVITNTDIPKTIGIYNDSIFADIWEKERCKL